MRFAFSPATAALVLAGLSLAAGGCTSAQSGIFAGHWCTTDPSAGVTAQILDDMEDGDGKACDMQGSWSVINQGGGATVPALGAIKASDDLLASDLAPGAQGQVVRTTGLRALHLTGTGFQGGEWAGLRVDLADGDLSQYNEVQFWARSDNVGSLEFRAAVATAATATNGGVHWGIPVMVTENWGDGQGKPFSFPLIGEGDKMVPDEQKDLAHSQAIEFQVRVSAGMTSFGFWIDDIVLKRRPATDAP